MYLYGFICIISSSEPHTQRSNVQRSTCNAPIYLLNVTRIKTVCVNLESCFLFNNAPCNLAVTHTKFQKVITNSVIYLSHTSDKWASKARFALRVSFWKNLCHAYMMDI